VEPSTVAELPLVERWPRIAQGSHASGWPAPQMIQGSGIRSLGLVVLTEALSVKADALSALYYRTISSMQDRTDLPSDRVPRRRRHQRRFTTAEIAEIGEQYQAGRSMNELARQYGVYRKTIVCALERGNIPLRYRGLSPERVAEAAELYRAGCSLARLGEKYGCTDKAVSHALRQHGVEIRPRRGWS
jgi:transposase-like protein